jgi:two-component system response regulator FlrC
MIEIDMHEGNFSEALLDNMRARSIPFNLIDGSEHEGVPKRHTLVCLNSSPEQNPNDLVPYLKKNGFKRAIMISLDASAFNVEEILNAAVVHISIPRIDENATHEFHFFVHYVIDLIARDTPNLPCQDSKTSELLGLIKKIAMSNATVLVNGPTGTGKEVVSGLIHHFSDRRDNPFVALNCAAIPEQMLESTLFGHEKGAFTGAVQQNKGLVRAADGGTILLDEISEMPLGLQAKLLRVLQERKVMPIGGTSEIDVDVRIVATTNRNMLAEVRNGTFREDLYYRLNVFPVKTHALAERVLDIPAIAAHILNKFEKNQVSRTYLDNSAFEKMFQHPWTGNVRELYNVLQRAQILCERQRVTNADLIFDDHNGEEQTNTADALAAKFQINETSELRA